MMLKSVVCLIASVAIFPCASSFTPSSLSSARQLSHVLFETRESAPIRETETTPSRFSVTRPKIHFTVPGYKVGWRDEDGNWYDEDGLRNGPPQNYWRQKADEREYNRDMEALSSVMAEYNIEETVRALEKRNSIRNPSLSRKLLGSWAPILLSNELVSFTDMPANDEGDVELQYKIDIYRKNGRKFAPRSYYGLFDLKLDNGEELIVESKNNSFRRDVVADETNTRIDLGLISSGDDKRLLFLGGLTYVSDYILVERDAEGAIDFWMRCDESYLGLNEEADEGL